MKEQLTMQFEFYRERIGDWLQNLNERERLLVGLAVGAFVIVSLFYVIESAYSKMEEQNTRLQKAERDLQSLGPLLQRHNKLSSQKVEIESQFLQTDGRVPARSYIEDIAKNRANIASQLTIHPNNPTDFGADFRRTNFKVSFQPDSLDQLVAFLEAVEEGSQPLLLTRIDINRIGGNQLRFSAEMSSIEPK